MEAKIGFWGLLQLLLITLKLTKTIDWSWWWVLSPIWVSVVLFVLVMVILVVLGFVIDRS